MNYEPIILFDQIIEQSEGDILQHDFSILGDIEGLAIQNFLYASIQEFNSFPRERLFESTSPNLSKLINFLRSKVPIKACIAIASHWPVVIPITMTHLRSLFFILVKMTYQTEDPSKFLYWMTGKLFPKFWSKKNSIFNGTLLSFCKFNLPNNPKKKLWAVLDIQNKFYVYDTENSISNPIFECEALEIKIEPNNNICIYNLINEKSYTFIPEEKEQINLWKSILDKKHAPFPYFLRGYEEKLPEPIIKAIFLALTAHDMALVRSICHPNVTLVKDGVPIVEALFEVLSYDGKINFLINTLVAQEFEEPSLTPELILRGNSNLTNLFKVFFRKYGMVYFNSFLIKIIKYIDNLGDIGLKDPKTCNMKKAEIAYFSVLKYISGSIQFIPPEIRHFASVLKSYIEIRFNDKQTVLNTLSGFLFLRFISSAIATPKTYLPNIKIKNNSNLVTFAKLLQVAFNFSFMSSKNPEFSHWDLRLKHHIYPKLEEFLFSIADITKSPNYSNSNETTVLNSVALLYKQISLNYESFISKYNESIDSNIYQGGCLSWNFSSAISMMFKHLYDKDIFIKYLQQKKNERKSTINIQSLDGGNSSNIHSSNYPENYLDSSLMTNIPNNQLPSIFVLNNNNTNEFNIPASLMTSQLNLPIQPSNLIPSPINPDILPVPFNSSLNNNTNPSTFELPPENSLPPLPEGGFDPGPINNNDLSLPLPLEQEFNSNQLLNAINKPIPSTEKPKIKKIASKTIDNDITPKINKNSLKTLTPINDNNKKVISKNAPKTLIPEEKPIKKNIKTEKLPESPPKKILKSNSKTIVPEDIKPKKNINKTITPEDNNKVKKTIKPSKTIEPPPQEKKKINKIEEIKKEDDNKNKKIIIKKVTKTKTNDESSKQIEKVDENSKKKIIKKVIVKKK